MSTQGSLKYEGDHVGFKGGGEYNESKGKLYIYTYIYKYMDLLAFYSIQGGGDKIIIMKYYCLRRQEGN